MQSNTMSTSVPSPHSHTRILAAGESEKDPVLITATSPSPPPSVPVASSTSTPASQLLSNQQLPNKETNTQIGQKGGMAEQGDVVEKLEPPAEHLNAPLNTIMPVNVAERVTTPTDLCPPPQSDSSSSTSTSASSSTLSSSQPHALKCWPSIESHLRNKLVVVFLDYDGTLTPIVSVPSAARLSQQQRKRLARLAESKPAGIVTGRTIETIKKFVFGDEEAESVGKEELDSLRQSLSKLYFAGSHGFDICCPPDDGDGRSGSGSSSRNLTVADEYRPLLEHVFAVCSQSCASIAGALVEDCKFSVSVHYRLVASAEEQQRVHDIVAEAVKPYKGKLKLHAGKMVHEIKPDMDWHKGAAVRYLLPILCPQLPSPLPQSGELRTRDPDGRSVVPVYIGDDTTDEDAFRILAAYTGSSRPLTVFVRTDDRARPSHANYVLKDPDEVGTLLEKIAQI